MLHTNLSPLLLEATKKKMIIISLIVGTAIVSAERIRGRIEVNPTNLESKISNEKPSYREEYKYIASLQLNGFHICNSGMFREGFLLTTGDCAHNIGKGIQMKQQRATAVLANPNLKDGQRINILKIAYYSTYSTYEFEIGVIMLANNVDYTHVQDLSLYSQRMNLQEYGADARVCGWSPKDTTAQTNCTIVENFDNFHCTSLSLYGDKPCLKAIHFGDYKRKLICGREDKKVNPKTTLVDLGSPLTKIINEKGKSTKYIVGVTIHKFNSEIGLFHRFIRINAVSKDIQDLINQLE